MVGSRSKMITESTTPGYLSYNLRSFQMLKSQFTFSIQVQPPCGEEGHPTGATVIVERELAGGQWR